jgi:tRNA threonylcarbamoyl adenosine modification protein (Sua5/YciO/YrdC/YwlC family)
MTLFFDIHPDNPQTRLLNQAANLLKSGGVLAVPTDSSYALVCHLDDKNSVETLRRIRGVDERHHLTLLCRDLKELASFARVDNWQFRLLKNTTPGPYTFILEASKEVPRRLSHPKRLTIGLRVPEHKVLQALLEAHAAPLIATTLILPNHEEALNDAEEIMSLLDNQVKAVINAGACPRQATTVVDLSGGEVHIVRRGRGDLGKLGVTG